MAVACRELWHSESPPMLHQVKNMKISMIILSDSTISSLSNVKAIMDTLILFRFDFGLLIALLTQDVGLSWKVVELHGERRVVFMEMGIMISFAILFSNFLFIYVL